MQQICTDYWKSVVSLGGGVGCYKTNTLFVLLPHKKMTLLYQSLIALSVQSSVTIADDLQWAANSDTIMTIHTTPPAFWQTSLNCWKAGRLSRSRQTGDFITMVDITDVDCCAWWLTVSSRWRWCQSTLACTRHIFASRYYRCTSGFVTQLVILKHFDALTSFCQMAEIPWTPSGIP